MPLHNWTTIESGVYHHFHQRWISAISDRLNGGLLPPEFYALAERPVEDTVPDVLGFHIKDDDDVDESWPGGAGGVATLAPPRKQFMYSAAMDDAVAVSRANRIAVRTTRHKVVAVIELISPGNKNSRPKLDDLLDKTVGFIQDGVNVLVVDPFPPGPRDPQGLHPLIWENFAGDFFELPEDKPYTMASYQAKPLVQAFVEPIGLGELLPDMPLFLRNDFYIDVPLEATYQDTVKVIPKYLLPDS